LLLILAGPQDELGQAIEGKRGSRIPEPFINSTPDAVQTTRGAKLVLDNPALNLYQVKNDEILHETSA
jgi:hypothetical protein